MNPENINILFIDDEPDSVEYHIRTLREAGYNVDIMDDENDALAFCSKNKHEIDLLILDVMLPVPDDADRGDLQDGLRTGIYFLEKYREWNHTTPVLLFSCRGLKDLVNEAWGSYLQWLSQNEITHPEKGMSHQEKEQVLRTEFKVWIRNKPTTPPFMMPTVVKDILS